MSHIAIARWGAVLAGLAVVFGAYGAHGLESLLSQWGFGEELAQRLEWFETGVRYQFPHALALLLIGWAGNPHSRLQRIAAAAFLLGTLLFSGSLYGLTLLDASWRKLGAITPLGGLALIVGWALLAIDPRGQMPPEKQA